MKVLTESELSTLSRQERYDYYDKIRMYEWSLKTWSEKKQEIFSNYHYVVNRRGIESITLEEEIQFFKNNNPITSVGECQQKNKSENFTFFWETSSPFSQWHKSKFKSTTCLIEGINKIKKKDILKGEFPLEEQEYSSVEQFMMFHKAIIFLDIESAKKIMGVDNVRKIKELGREVQNFDETIWKYYRSKIVFEGNKAKFTQNQSLKEKLFLTKETTLVEASPYDNIWGIGLSVDNPKAKLRDTWEGLNLLGEILTKVRVELMGEY